MNAECKKLGAGRLKRDSCLVLLTVAIGNETT